MKKRIIIILSLLMLAISAIFIANLKSTKANEQIANSEENQISKEIKDLTKKEGIKFAYTYQGAPTNLDLDDLISGVGVTYSATLTCTNGTTGTIENGHVKITNISIPSECSIDFDDVTTYQVTLAAANSSEGTQQKNIIAGSSDTFTVTPSSGYTLTGATVSCSQATASINTSTGVVTVSNVTEAQTCTVTLKPTYTITFSVNGGSTWTSSTCTSPSTLSSTTCTKTVVNGETYGTLPTPTRSNYVFTGWYTSSSGGTNITESTTVSLSANQTLYAQWAIGRTVTMNVTGGTSSPASITVARGSSAEFTITPDTGYTLTGATVSCQRSTASIDETTGVVTVSNVAWDQTCTVTLNSLYNTVTMSVTGGTSSPASSAIDAGGSSTFAVTPDTGYTLTGATVSCTQATASLNETTGVVTVSNVTQTQTCTVTLAQIFTITYTGFSRVYSTAPTEINSSETLTFTYASVSGYEDTWCGKSVYCTNATCTSTSTYIMARGYFKYTVTMTNPTDNVIVRCSNN